MRSIPVSRNEKESRKVGGGKVGKSLLLLRKKRKRGDFSSFSLIRSIPERGEYEERGTDEEKGLRRLVLREEDDNGERKKIRRLNEKGMNFLLFRSDAY